MPINVIGIGGHLQAGINDVRIDLSEAHKNSLFRRTLIVRMLAVFHNTLAKF
jgi:hypothetical protein